MRVERYGNTRYWAVYASDGALICITVYRKGGCRSRQALAASPGGDTAMAGYQWPYKASRVERSAL